MVILVVSVKIKAGLREEYLRLFKEFARIVHQEKGCIEYFAAVDQESGLDIQVKDPDTVTVIEKWVSLAALKEHLGTADMRAFGEKTGHMALHRSIKVLQAA